MAHLTDAGKISKTDLFITCLSWFTVNWAAWSCAISLVFRKDIESAILYMGMGGLMGLMFCIDMHFYSKNGDVLERDLKEIIA